MGSDARVSVGVPVFRGEGYVAEVLESIRHQTYRNFEVLVSIDASDKASAKICREFEVDQRFRIYSSSLNGFMDRERSLADRSC